MKSKIEKLTQFESGNIDCKSPTDYHFCAKSIDESKASVYFTPNDGHLSPQPSQLSPIHVNYINDEAGAAGGFDGSHRSSMKNARYNNPQQRNSFLLPSDYLDEEDEASNFIIPEPIYADPPLSYKDDRFHDILDDVPLNMLMIDAESMSSIASASDMNRSRRRKKKYRERKSNYSVENEAFLMHEMMDESTGARRKIFNRDMPSTSSSTSTSNCGSRKESSAKGE